MFNERRSTNSLGIATIFEVGTFVGLADSELLLRYLTSRREVAEAAFRVLVERHGPLVKSVCRMTLGQEDDAQDAFQATFLILARRAGSIRRSEAVGSWLHGVAFRVSLRLRSANSKRHRQERAYVKVDSGSDAARERDRGDQAAALHEEIARMPNRFRSVLVLCDLEESTYEAAAISLNCPVGTVKSRLARARCQLRDRLSRRGIATLTPLGKLPAISILKVDATTRLAFAGTSVLVIENLVQGVTRMLIFQRLQFAGIVVLAAGLTIGAGAKLSANGKVHGLPKVLQTTAAGIQVGGGGGGAVGEGGLGDANPKQGEPADSPNDKTLQRLEKTLDLQFPNETPVSEFLEHIKDATSDKDNPGIQFHLDLVGFQNADRTVMSPISLELANVPIKLALELMARQLGLAYGFRDGIVIISSPEDIHVLLDGEEPVFTTETPLERLIHKAERGELNDEDTEQLKKMIEGRVLVEQPDTPNGGGGMARGDGLKFSKNKPSEDIARLQERIQALEQKIDRLIQVMEPPKPKLDK